MADKHIKNLGYNLNYFKVTPKTKIQDNNKNSSNRLKNVIKKTDSRPKIQKNLLQINASKLNSNISSTVEYHYILDELMKYLENKIKPKLYEEVNNYLNKTINNYLLEKLKVDLNQDKNKKRNIKPYTFSSKKYKSYLKINIVDKNKQNINKNNYLFI